ncbi:MAG: YwaF family protein [Erysipelotrichaceae bacterium]|nr:YwaF family protein [Erysipelotrichaceae bacterium]
MFSIYHIIWLVICLAIVAGFTVYLKKNKPELKDVLSVCCVVCVLSEIIKVFSMIRMVPSSDGSLVYPYIELNHMPLHLCSIQILIIFYARFSKKSDFHDSVLAFMYPTTILGAFMALAMPSIYSTTIRPDQSFTHPMAYQFFLYHTMLIILGLYIYRCGEVEIRPKHYFSTMGIVALMAFLSLYVNSLLASPTYVNGQLVSVDFITNMFFTYRPPINIALTEIWHWYLYLAVITVLAFALVAVFYIPVFRRAKRK